MTMTNQQIITHCLSKTGAKHEYKMVWEADVLTVGGKMFAFSGGDKAGERIINLKNSPAENEIMREKYEDWVTAGYYSNKDHWNSWYWARENFDFELLREQIDISYALVAKSLPKSVQKELGL